MDGWPRFKEAIRLSRHGPAGTCRSKLMRYDISKICGPVVVVSGEATRQQLGRCTWRLQRAVRGNQSPSVPDDFQLFKVTSFGFVHSSPLRSRRHHTSCNPSVLFKQLMSQAVLFSR